MQFKPALIGKTGTNLGMQRRLARRARAAVGSEALPHPGIIRRPTAAHPRRPAGSQGDVADAIRARLEDEPYVKEFPGSRLASDRRVSGAVRLTREGGIIGVQKKGRA